MESSYVFLGDSIDVLLGFIVHYLVNIPYYLYFFTLTVEHYRYKLGFLNAVLKFLVVMDMHRILDLPVTVDNLNFKIKLCSPVKLVQQSANDENISASSESVTDVPQIHRNREGFEANIRAQYTSLEELLSCFWRLYCAVGAVATDSSLPTLVATVDMKGVTWYPYISIPMHTYLTHS